MAVPVVVEPLAKPPHATLQLPGSKSITNRALLLAALAPGTSTLEGALSADDTDAMAGAVAALGAVVERQRGVWRVTGADGTPPRQGDAVDARRSGTTARFIAPVLAAREGRWRLDGDDQLRSRPMAPLLDALRALGARVDDEDRPGHLPVVIAGPAAGGAVTLPGDVSSQFLSGLLMAAPLFRNGISIGVTTPLVSAPYLDMTRAVMRAFGVEATLAGHAGGARYTPCHYRIEPDASGASYFFAAAAITGGQVTVRGLDRDSIQGDVRFVDVLARMGALVSESGEGLTVRGTGTLRGVDVDLRDLPDAAPTLAATAVFADGPTRVRGVGFIRGHESDRIDAVVTELGRCGIESVAHDDGFTVVPGRPTPAVVRTYGDHRIAMSFALLGLRTKGIEISDPECVAKTYPGFFADLEALRR